MEAKGSYCKDEIKACCLEWDDNKQHLQHSNFAWKCGLQSRDGVQAQVRVGGGENNTQDLANRRAAVRQDPNM